MRNKTMKIYYCDLGKAVNDKEIGTRPVVVTDQKGDTVTVNKITSRNKTYGKYVRMNPYKIYGFCDVGQNYKVHKADLISYVRDCTKSEVDNILSMRKSKPVFISMTS